MPNLKLSPSIISELNAIPRENRVDFLIKDAGATNPLMHQIIRNPDLLNEVLALCPTKERIKLLQVTNYQGTEGLSLARGHQQAYEIILNAIPEIRRRLSSLDFRSLCKTRQASQFFTPQTSSQESTTSQGCFLN